ncbi:transcription antitermination factor NusB [Lancefieldella rimae]|uniref:transcription antitermination factor NusB n=1 Tax=Lancefieldella rimae TaxID=1383 RepID=UPI0028804445|nr:transcription antitermination factor NusB [Lancefieldella rimae]
MAKLAPARAAALDLAAQCRRKHARMRDFLRTSHKMDVLGEKDRALAMRLLLGSVSAVGELDRVLASYLPKRRHLEPKLRDALRLAAFEILYLHTPKHVAVSQGVEMARRASAQATGLANAILRRIAADVSPRVDEARARLHAGNDERLLEDLAHVSGQPNWLCQKLVASMGVSVATPLLLHVLEPAPVYVALREGLSHDVLSAFDPHASVAPQSFFLESPAGLAASDLVAHAKVLPADISSQLVALLALSGREKTLLEIGQGRGTKTILLQQNAALLNHALYITAIDIDPQKVETARKRLVEAVVDNQVTSVVFNAAELGAREASGELPGELAHTFDTVFIDAPCSGAGTLQRHPEIGWSLDENAVCSDGILPKVQKDILVAASGKVAAHGTLVYATCSPLYEEDEAVVEAFLATEEGSSFEPEDITESAAFELLSDVGKQVVQKSQTKTGYAHFGYHPDILDADQHFLAKLRRIG